MTDQCIDLEKSLMDEREKTAIIQAINNVIDLSATTQPKDFQTHILQELGIYKSENENLQTIT